MEPVQGMSKILRCKITSYLKPEPIYTTQQHYTHLKSKQTKNFTWDVCKWAFLYKNFPFHRKKE